MIASPQEYLTTWYKMWQDDLAKNLAQQADLQADEAQLRNLIATCEKAFAVLFPAPPAPEPTPAPTPVDPTQTL